jgi:regulatory protein
MVHFEFTGKSAADTPENETLAPVTYLRRGGSAVAPAATPATEPEVGDALDDALDDVDGSQAREQAEKVLLHRLRGRSLSRSEAVTVLRSTDVDSNEIEEIIARFEELHYLDENKLAEQIVHSHHVRKGLGRTGVSVEMRRRGLSADIIAEKLDELPDDETERAIELASTRISQLERFDNQTIDRRLSAFLQRKGYGSQIIRIAVKAAMESRSGGNSGVRFR